MDNKTDKERNAKEGYSFGNENKQNGFMENRAELQKIWRRWS